MELIVQRGEQRIPVRIERLRTRPDWSEADGVIRCDFSIDIEDLRHHWEDLGKVLAQIDKKAAV